jgi:hypothetical protein
VLRAAVQVAQSVEQRTENPRVASSILALDTEFSRLCECSANALDRGVHIGTDQLGVEPEDAVAHALQLEIAARIRSAAAGAKKSTMKRPSTT